MEWLSAPGLPGSHSAQAVAAQRWQRAATAQYCIPTRDRANPGCSPRASAQALQTAHESTGAGLFSTGHCTPVHHVSAPRPPSPPLEQIEYYTAADGPAAGEHTRLACAATLQPGCREPCVGWLQQLHWGGPPVWGKWKVPAVPSRNLPNFTTILGQIMPIQSPCGGPAQTAEHAFLLGT